MTKREVANQVIELAACGREIDGTCQQPEHALLRQQARQRATRLYVDLQAQMFRYLKWFLDVRMADVAYASDATIRQLVSEAFARARNAGIIGEPIAHAHLPLTVGKPKQERGVEDER